MLQVSGGLHTALWQFCSTAVKGSKWSHPAESCGTGRSLILEQDLSSWRGHISVPLKGLGGYLLAAVPALQEVFPFPDVICAATFESHSFSGSRFARMVMATRWPVSLR